MGFVCTINENSKWGINEIQVRGTKLINFLIEHWGISEDLFDKAKDKFRENQPNYMDLINEVKKDNFEIKTYKDDFGFQLDKEKWYQMIKDRFMSDLSEFSNEEIDEGIAELEKKLIGNTLEIIDEIIFIYGKKI